MSADVISLSRRARMPWEDTRFTAEQRTVLYSLAHTAISAGGVRDYTFSEITNGHHLYFISGRWEAAPSIVFYKKLEQDGLRYGYNRTGGDMMVTEDFLSAVSAARHDLQRFGAQTRAEMESHAHKIAVKNRRAGFQLVTKSP